MDGILIIDKPSGITSHDVVSRVRRILRTKRVGHTGTLDPFATGVMTVVVGRATRLAQFLDKDEKEYEAVMRLGFETDTGDLTGTPRSSYQQADDDFAKVSDQTELENILSKFRGEIEQVPPMYSAKKIDGQKLYELARKGETVERKSVTVTISKLEIIETNIDGLIKFRAACSAGTYIRTLAEDIAKAAGTHGHLTELRRIRSGTFSLEQAVTLDQLADSTEPETFLLPMVRAVEHLQQVVLNDDRIEKTRSGMSSRVYKMELGEDAPVCICSESGELVAIGIFDAEERSVRPKVVLI